MKIGQVTNIDIDDNQSPWSETRVLEWEQYHCSEILITPIRKVSVIQCFIIIYDNKLLIFN
jgi:hypothetical protein